MIRPSWLSALVLTQRLKSEETLRSNSQITNVDSKLKTILNNLLPGDSTVTNLEKSADMSIYFSLISRTLETFPIHVISRQILLNKRVLKDEIKLSSDSKLKSILKELDKEKPKEMNKTILFDNGVGLSQKNFNTCLDECIKLLTELQFKPSSTMWQLHY